jgi:hypothetical protein
VVSVQHAAAKALDRHLMFVSDGHCADKPELEPEATATAICAYAAGEISHAPRQ